MNRRKFLQSGATIASMSLIASSGMASLSRAQESPVPPLPPPGADGWISLLNFKNLDGIYTMLEHSGKGVAEKRGMVTFEDGMLHILGNLVTDEPSEAGYIATHQEFANYRLRAEYKWGVKRFPPRLDTRRDSGLLYHLVGEDKVWPDCVECQIEEAGTCDYFLLGNTRAVPDHGDQIGGIGPGGKHLSNRKVKELGGPFEKLNDWNVIEVIVQGNQSTQILNGSTLNTLSGFQWADPRNPGQWVPLTRGKIAVEIEFAETWYRRLEIKALA